MFGQYTYIRTYMYMLRPLPVLLLDLPTCIHENMIQSAGNKCRLQSVFLISADCPGVVPGFLCSLCRLSHPNCTSLPLLWLLDTGCRIYTCTRLVKALVASPQVVGHSALSSDGPTYLVLTLWLESPPV